MKWLVLYFVFITNCIQAQKFKLSEPVTNNAVAALKKNGYTSFYSFYGLDSTKKWSGVHNKILRYNLHNRQSGIVGTLPDVGRLASSVSVINNKAYLVGGYTVLENGKEKSSDQLFIFNPQTESVTRGATLPLRIDDHIQGVWRNKILFVISGWSDSLTVNTVQIYDPETNHWEFATPLPNEVNAKVFGGCGLIEGDTIYVLGGATFTKYYPPSQHFYKGIIDTNNPLNIKWIDAGEYPGEHRYRSAAVKLGDQIYFIGGSDKTYNYNGISYDTRENVEPNRTNLIYDPRSGKFRLQSYAKNVMDLRGVVSDENGNTYTLGGMKSGQQVTSEIRLLSRN